MSFLRVMKTAGKKKNDDKLICALGMADVLQNNEASRSLDDTCMHSARHTPVSKARERNTRYRWYFDLEATAPAAASVPHGSSRFIVLESKLHECWLDRRTAAPHSSPEFRNDIKGRRLLLDGAFFQLLKNTSLVHFTVGNVFSNFLYFFL